MRASNTYQDCIEACNACAVACNACFAECLKEAEVKMMARCISLDMDCAAMCTLAANAMARNSEMAKHFCRLCSEACLACAAECEQHHHDHCKECAQACKQCAQACQKMIN